MQLNLSVPDSWKDFIDAEVAAGAHDGPGSYVETLLRDARQRKTSESIEALLEQGLNSGEATPWTPQDKDDIRREIAKRHVQSNGNAR